LYASFTEPLNIVFQVLYFCPMKTPENTSQPDMSSGSKVMARPVLKWAGGKTQLLKQLLPATAIPYNRYIEPFLGGGAFFFALRPEDAVIGDSNPELINVYRTLVDNVEGIIKKLAHYSNDKDLYYSVRAIRWETLDPVEAAARTIYLNRTCYNGLFRVNKKGQFNVPYGRYKNPKICDAENLRAAALVLRQATIVQDDYKEVLCKYARKGDFVYLDPPYLPISEFSDFKRYTKEQFYEEDHRELAEEARRLHRLGCHIVLTNSNAPLIRELYKDFHTEVVETRRNISKKGDKRSGQDLIIHIPPQAAPAIPKKPRSLNGQSDRYPPSRFMGSKRKIRQHILDVAEQFDFDTVLDLFSGSGTIAYMFKAQGKRVLANDHMAMAATYATAMIENNRTRLSSKEIERLLEPNSSADHFVSETFRGLYYSDADNELIDSLRANIKKLRNRYKRAIAMSALIRACVKKRPRGIFTYVGFRYDDGRKDLRTPLGDHFRNAAELINNAVFDNGQENSARRGDAMSFPLQPDLVYIDPPYYSPLSDNDYVRRYHFVEGLARNWKGVEIQQHTKTKKFKNYPTPFSSRNGAHEALDNLFRKYRKSIIIVSYSSNSLPSKEDIIALMAQYKNNVEAISIDHRYSFANQGHKTADIKNGVKEYLFTGS